MNLLRNLFAVCAPLALLTGCPETVGQQCPSNAAPIGQYQLTFALPSTRPTDECRITSIDGGAADASLAQDNAPTQIATLCAGPGDAGAIALTLAVPGKQSRTTDLQDGGSFTFVSSTPATPGTVCGCSLAIDETFAGTLHLPEDAGFALQPDGGLPLVTSVTGNLVDVVTTPTPPCNCNIPCQLQYEVSGTRF